MNCWHRVKARSPQLALSALLGTFLLAGCHRTPMHKKPRHFESDASMSQILDRMTEKVWVNIPPNAGPNYVERLADMHFWQHCPVKVAFVRDANYSLHREQMVCDGFDRWVHATKSRITYTVVPRTTEADLLVRYDPKKEISETNSNFNPATHVNTHADMVIGLADSDSPGQVMPDDDLQAISAHEFGHALGVDGHSDSPGDLMYPSLDQNRTVTVRDLNTVRAVYQ